MKKLNTTNLIIREIKNTDINPLFELLSNKEVMHYSVHGPYSMQQTKDWISFMLDHYAQNILGMWAVTEKSNDSLIGICGFMPLEGDNKYEIGYRIHPKFQGKGYATEAAIAIKDYAIKMQINDFVAFIEEENKASIRVAEKIGMRFLNKDLYKNIPVLLYGYTNSKTK